MDRPYQGFLPVALIIALIAALRVSVDPSVFYDPGWLIPVTNTLFVTLTSLAVAYVALRHFTATGRSQILLLGCATLVFGLAAACAAFARGLPDGANQNVTIYNTGALSAALLYGVSAMALLAGRSPTVATARRGPLVLAGYATALAFTTVLTVAALLGATPPFFIQGTGPTLLRQGVLGAADVLFVFSALIFVGTSFRTREPFLYWYGLGLALTAVSLSAFFIQSSVGSPVGWAGRASQYLGGLYLLVALVAARSAAHERKASLDSVLTFSLDTAAGRASAAGEESADAAGRMDRDLRHVYLEQSADAFYAKDAQGRYLLFNSEAARATGKLPHEVIGRDDTFLFPASQAASIMAGDREVMEGRRVVTYEEVLETVAGATTYLATKGPLFDDNGKVVGLFGFARDVTEQKRAEAALYKSEERFRSTLDQMLEGAMIIGFDWRYLYVNDVAASHGRTVPDDIIGRSMPEVYPGIEGSEVFGRYREAMEGRVPQRFDAPFTFADGTTSHYHFSVEPVAEGIFVFSADITERKAVEEALRESEERFRALVESANDAIFIWDRESLRCLEANRAACKRLGYTRAELLTMTVAQISAPEQAAAIAARAAEIGERASALVETVHLARDGTRIPAEVSTTVANLGGRPVFLSIARDVTERKQAEAARASLEAQLAQAEKMESVGRLAGGVAHDFNNMLGVILGNAELALEALEPSHPVRADLLEIQGAAMRSADLTRQLLAFARRQTVAPRPLDLNEAVSGMLDMLRRLNSAGVELAWRPGAGLWPVRVDPSQLDQILTNLVVNAGDAVGDTGKITVETGNATLDAEFSATLSGAVPGDYVGLTVRDDGGGMDAETMNHLFEPFFTTKEAGRGTGLGLATVYGIVQQNGGFIDVSSEPGAGSVFRIWLPRHRGPAAAPEAPTQHVARGGGETVLLVEDEPALLRLATVMLERLGYQVVAAATPGEASRLAREHQGQIHLLMTDVVLPGMNGRDLARNLQPLYAGLRCLFISGYTADVIADHGLLDVGVHFLQKPFSARNLAARVREALDHDPVSPDPVSAG